MFRALGFDLFGFGGSGFTVQRASRGRILHNLLGSSCQRSAALLQEPDSAIPLFVFLLCMSLVGDSLPSSTRNPLFSVGNLEIHTRVYKKSLQKCRLS